MRLPHATAVAALCCAPLAWADHWISVGAYRAVEAAGRVAAETSEHTRLRFAAVPAETAEGELHRVVAGPYATRKEADADLARVRALGFVEAWVLDTGQQATPTTPAAATAQPQAEPMRASAAPPRLETLTVEPADPALALPNYLDDELPPIEVLLEGLPDIVLPLEPATPPESAEPAQEEPEEAAVPEDYQLHRLHRREAAAPNAEPHAGIGPFAGFDARVKWYSTAQSLPEDDALRQVLGESTPVGHNADLRLMWRRSFGPVKLTAHHSTTWIHSDLDRADSLGLTFDQTPTGDARRLADLTWELERSDGKRLLHRFDRLAIEYRSERWGASLGRQAVSWGGGLVFQPMDLFNPFAPTTVDQEYKAGDDLLLVERLFDDGSDLQMLAVGRRSFDGSASFDSASIAVKYHALVDDNELEFMASNHYGGQVYGVGLRLPVAGALVRSDVTWTVDHDQTTISGVLNADYSFGVAGTIVHVFGEYFHNGFGVNRLPRDLRHLPVPLLLRTSRGELFNLMRNYVAFGTSFRWRYLLNQTVAVIGNLHDHSLAAQLALTYDTGDESRLQVGLTKPFGQRGDEFGGVTVGEGLTVGGGTRGYLRFVYFF